MRGARCGVTLAELLVAIVILSVLMALAVIGVGGVRESSRSTRCRASLSQLAMALRMYMDNENRGVLPVVPGYPDRPDRYMEIVPLLERHMDAPVKAEGGGGGGRSVLVCPTDRTIGPVRGFSYDYVPGALFVDYAGSGEHEAALLGRVMRGYEDGLYTILFWDIAPWHGTLGRRMRNAARFDGGVVSVPASRREW